MTVYPDMNYQWINISITTVVVTILLYWTIVGHHEPVMRMLLFVKAFLRVVG